MLTYNIRLTNILPDSAKVNIQSYSINDLIDDVVFYGSEENPNIVYTYSNQQLLVCRYDDEPNLKEGADIVIKGSIDIDDDTNIERTSLNKYEYITSKVAGVNDVDKTFTVFIDKYRILGVESLARTNMRGNEDDGYGCTLTFTFVGPHYFRRSDENIKIHANFDDGSEEVIPCIYVDNQTLETIEVYDINDDENSLYNKLYYGGGLAIGTIIHRENPWFSPNGIFEIYSTNILTSVIVPITDIFTPDMCKNGLLNDYYVGDEVQTAINKANDMEKDVYHPVYVNEDGVKDVQNLRFNIHLRQRDGDNWTIVTDPDNKTYRLWNYYECNKNDIINEHITNDNVSDLLSFLDFNNNDVRYRKKKLSKTFLRLSFYDSPDEKTQNLLHTSTIFVNVNDLYAKYNRYGHDTEEDFMSVPKHVRYDIVEDTETNNSSFNLEPLNSELKSGIKVDTENLRNGMISGDESKRLSSQFSVFDRNASTNSSEGFYFYLWKDHYYGIEPTDIYLKIDLNHAKYGRLIPLMVPFSGPIRDEGEAHSLMTLTDMVNQWTDESDATDHIIDGTGFTNYEYMDYRYIRLRYRYDRDLQKHIYYLNNDFYDNLDNIWENSGVYSEDDNSITINLFEANMK